MYLVVCGEWNGLQQKPIHFYTFNILYEQKYIHQHNIYITNIAEYT